MEEGATLAEIRALMAEKCGVAEEECNCEEIRQKLETLRKTIELAIEVALVVIPALATARKVMKLSRAADAIASEEELRKVQNLLQSSERVAQKQLQEVKLLLDKMYRTARPIVIKE